MGKGVADPDATVTTALEAAITHLPKSPVETRPNSALSTPQ